MKLSGAALALIVVLLGTATGAAATSGEGRIVFASGLPSYPPPANLNVSRIYSIGVDGRGRRNVGGTAGWGASLSPDGTKIAYWRRRPVGDERRRVGATEGAVAGTARWELTRDRPMLFDAAESPGRPTGQSLPFSGAVVDLDGAVVGSTGHDPAWSPDGKWLVSVVDESDYDGLRRA